MNYDLIVIGGGAAGFFAAIAAAEVNPKAKISIIEKSSKVLSKVKVSGGGRCNVTHNCFEVSNLVKFYPRGQKFLKHFFHQFNVKETVEWFSRKGVELKTEEDGRMFPVTDNSQTIINCLYDEITRLKIYLQTSVLVKDVKTCQPDLFRISTLNSDTYFTRALILATGGNPKLEAYSWISSLGIKIIPPVPSLFTFNVPDSDLKDLAGISVPRAVIRITGTKLEYEGPLLITHWGFSGPAILKLSAWGARILNEMNYNFNIQIRWLSELTEEFLRKKLEEIRFVQAKRKISTHSVFGLPERLWQRLINKSGIDVDLKWADLSRKNKNLLIENLSRAGYTIKGKTTFKEEFVTCGGVDLSGLNKETMQSKQHPGLFFAGEVLDIDGITGGFNFQSAWTTGFVAGRNAGSYTIENT
ncbi:NAD(P)/FAD-dependent oxidoreductase [soil metagenome]